MIGCQCPTCTSGNPRNKRLRPSALVELGDKRFIIDVGPDFRAQALKHRIDYLDGILLTHAHFDHIAGIDELRVLTFRDGLKIPCLLSWETFEEIKARFYYMMQPMKDSDEVVCAHLKFHFLKKGQGSLVFEGVPITFFSYSQIGMQVMGYRLGDFAYVSDIHDYDDTIFEALSGVKTLVLEALREEENRAHFTIDQAVGFAKKAGVEKVVFTHLGHELDHEKTNQKLPPNMQLGYDGLEIYFEIDEL